MIDNKFVVVVPVYNAEKYIKKCMYSILNQDYDNFDIVVIDDCSTDNTTKILKKLYKEYEFDLIINDKRVGSALSNIVKGINLKSNNEEDIIITVDGDDWLSNDNVISYLNNIYQDNNIWMTYGQFIPASGTYGKYCKQIKDTKTYRKSGLWITSHLRTFKRKIWNLIKDEDLRDDDNEYYKIGSDTAWMYPLIELCGNNHIKFIDDVLYIYNDLSPFNDMKIHLKEQLRVIDIIKNKKEYNEINDN